MIVAVLCLAPGVQAGEKPDRRAFDEQVRPILAGKCLACHGQDKRKGGLDLTRREHALAGGESGEAIVPGRPEESLLFERVSAGEMPPDRPLKPAEIDAIRSWIHAGASYPEEPLKPSRAGADWWSLQKIVRPPVPEVPDAAWIRTPIDAFVLQGLRQHGLSPAPEADRATLIRRLSFDLLGLPPTPQEVQRFVADPAPDAYDRLVDRLLASPHYGERWGRHWLDVVRFGESHGYEMNQPRPNAWPYRDYVIRAFNRDTPFAQFVLEQLAGDTIGEADWLTQAATGFLVAGTHDAVTNATVEGMRQQRMDDLDDMIATTATAYLGLTANCARCHDHKFDPITQRDYYGLQAVFAGVNHAERNLPAPDADRRKRETARLLAELAHVDRQLDAWEPLTGREVKLTRRPAVSPRRNVERFLPAAARTIRMTITATADGIQPCIDELEIFTAGEHPRNVARDEGVHVSASSVYPDSALHRLEHLNDGRYGNSRSWISNEPGAGVVTVKLPRTETIDRIVWGRDRDEKYKDRLASAYQIEVAEEPDRWRLVASSDDRLPVNRGKAIALETSASPERQALLQRQTELRAALADVTPTISVYAGTFTQPGATHLLKRGDPMQPGDEVAPSSLAAVQPPLAISLETPEAERRVALARWIASPANPLPARVIVNRVWQYHFGQGIVATPSDFGYQGSRPSHPELLDWLASEYIAGGGRLKPLHRLIVRSATYRQSSQVDESAQAADGQNQWLWRMSPRRLEAEALRDAILFTSGQLDLRMGGPSYSIWEKNTNYVAVYKPKADLEPSELRRMVYQLRPRSQPDPTFGAFDCPDASLTTPRRPVSTTALQALNLLNSRFMVAASSAFGQRLEREAGPDPGRQAERAFWLAFGRAPGADERAAAVVLIREHGAAALGRVVFNANEFLYVY